MKINLFKKNKTVAKPQNFSQLSKTDIKSLNAQSLIDDINDLKNTDKFRFYGLNVYVAPQGGGKTSSMIYHVLKLKEYFPLLKVYSNIQLNVNWDYEFIPHMEDVQNALQTADNGDNGCIILLDEIQTYFNSLQSRYISIADISAISQQRKRHLAVFGTVQQYNRLAKAFREQCFNVISCKTYLRLFCFYSCYTGDTLEVDAEGYYIGRPYKRGFYMQNRKLRDSYNTFAIVNLSTNADNNMYAQQ